VLALILLSIGVLALAHTAPFPFLFEAFRPSQSIWRMDARPDQPSIYLTFDDGPNPVWTPPLLDALAATDARATFFLIDDHITDDTRDIVRRIADEGHAIGLHSGTRGLMLESADDLAALLERNAGRIRGITGREPCRLFRPHAGWRGGEMYGGLTKAGYQLAGWSWGMWDFDWGRARRADRLAPRLARKASDGDIIVIHDGHHKNPRADRRYAVETVDALIPRLKEKGFQFGTICP
jgi:peptidoglycan/xylan/chitin deacetylase (PgdA/CDA1 family)